MIGKEERDYGDHDAVEKCVSPSQCVITKPRRHLVFVLASDGLWAYVLDSLLGRKPRYTQEGHLWMSEKLAEIFNEAWYECRDAELYPEQQNAVIRPYWEVFTERALLMLADRESYAPDRGRYDDLSMMVGMIELPPVKE